ncbi:hypothetical protein [Flavobacterium sp.]|uniref:hypothetical protein n=1 Tax=Flavobacterium sp. TaxID=239 RepID=UPI002B4B1D00|nr:hypothetical protein [Flavobacterium sp.]HLF53203.1 hypothetical protein [Flavobacterium sp.]
MYKSICLLFIIIFLPSCEKEIKSFKPTTKLENIMKNVELKNTLWDLRVENTCLTREIEKDESFKTFLKKTNDKDLISLTECEIPLIRCFAFKALVEKEYPGIREILLRHINDNEIVKLKNYDIELSLTVKSYMLEQLNPFSKTKNRFNKTEYIKIQDSFYKTE